MLGIHCFFSKPVQLGRNVSGVYKAYVPGKIFSDYALCMMILSALQWRKTNGSIKLYCDEPVYIQLRQARLLSCWDEVEILRDDSAGREINPQIFWSAAKFMAYEKQREPFACIDTDLIIWKKLDIRPEVDWQFAHWETIDMGDTSYPDIAVLSKPDGYVFPESAGEETLATNMCITVFNNMDFCKVFVSEAFRYMCGNRVKSVFGLHATPEVLYMEQRLPVLLSGQYGYTCRPFLDAVWSPKSFKFISDDPQYGSWAFNRLDDRMPFTHFWFYKKWAEEHLWAKFELERQLLHELTVRFPEVLSDISYYLRKTGKL
ncbi:DUF6734 family protein [uncultured Bacteroides sp.]|uniref:DUF6734 family protein n=1 Tax=uncultured Bacteroides sp. TaxID=162156 RepID=UPI002675167F|nr:DUF6734 family protein [uncultured Bacteroides sp.]